MRRLLSALCLLPALASAGPADLDPRFGTQGIAVHEYGLLTTQVRVPLLAFGPAGDGHVAIVMRQDDFLGRPERVQLDAQGAAVGTLDLSQLGLAPLAAHVYEDGRVLMVSGAFLDGTTVAARVDRHLPDGSPDPSFGGGDGFTQFVESGVGLVANAVDVRADGEIAIAGFRRVLADPDDTAHSFVGRLTAAGQPVTAFSADGLVVHDLQPNQSDDPDAVALLPGGLVLLCDSGNFAGQTDALLTRIRSTGSVDSYGSSGTLYYDTSSPQSNFNDRCEDIDVDPTSGATVMTVKRSNGITHGVRRVPVDHAGNAGLAFDNVVTPPVASATLRFDAQGRSLLMVTSVRATGIDVDLVRFAPGGNADAGFGIGGSVRHVIPQPAGAEFATLDIERPLLAIDRRGRLLAAASIYESADEANGWAVLRLMGDQAFADGFE